MSVRKIFDLFEDPSLAQKIKLKLPYLFQLAEAEASRNGKIGMEVGSARERILIALLMYKFGESNVDTSFGITESELDAKIFGEGVSVKSKTVRSSSSWEGVKVIWTVDQQKRMDFQNSYNPNYDILFARIFWLNTGGLYLIPLEVQRKILSRMGRTGYLKQPPVGTNPRGVEISALAMTQLVRDNETRKLDIHWSRDDSIQSNIYKKWLDQWIAR